MKYCLNYDNKLLNPDELALSAHHLGYYSQEDSTKRIIIILKDEELTEEMIAELTKVKNRIPNYTIKAYSPVVLQMLLDLGFNAFLGYTIDNWELFYELAEIGVSDIEVSGSICFQTARLKQEKETYNLILRCVPNFLVNALFLKNKKSHVNNFFIRPEDISSYEDIIDILDFSTTTPEKQKVYFNIYSRGHFDDDISLLIPAIGIHTHNAYIDHSFAEARLNCGQACIQKGRHCHLCSSFCKLTDTLVDRFVNKK